MLITNRSNSTILFYFWFLFCWNSYQMIKYKQDKDHFYGESDHISSRLLTLLIIYSFFHSIKAISLFLVLHNFSSLIFVIGQTVINQEIFNENNFQKLYLQDICSIIFFETIETQVNITIFKIVSFKGSKFLRVLILRLHISEFLVKLMYNRGQ